VAVAGITTGVVPKECSKSGWGGDESGLEDGSDMVITSGKHGGKPDLGMPFQRTPRWWTSLPRPDLSPQFYPKCKYSA